MVEAHTITIENPSMTMMGIPMADLDGLSLEATYAGDETIAPSCCACLGGEEVAAEGYALFDGRQLVLGADGLTDTYAVPLEKMMGDMGSVNSAEMEMLMQLFSRTPTPPFSRPLSPPRWACTRPWLPPHGPWHPDCGDRRRRHGGAGRLLHHHRGDGGGSHHQLCRGAGTDTPLRYGLGTGRNGALPGRLQ